MSSLWRRPGFLFRRCTQNTSAVFEQACGDLDLTARQYDYLFVLNQLREVGQTEIAEMLGLDWSTNTLVLKILERKGWIEREASKTDSRRRLVKISEAGQEIYRRAEIAARNAQAAVWAALDTQEREFLLDVLSKVIHGTELFLSERTSIRPRKPALIKK